MFGRIPNGFDDFRDCPLSTAFDQSASETHLERLNKLVYSDIRNKINIAQIIRDESLDTHRKIVTFAVGQLVLVQDVTLTSKWEVRYEGPFTVCEITKSGNYQVKDISGVVLPFTFPPNHIRPTPYRTESVDKSYPVKIILEHSFDLTLSKALIAWFNSMLKTGHQYGSKPHSESW
jgi:hypothetical protein